MGRKPIPRRSKIIRGTFKKYREPSKVAEPKPFTAAPLPPDHLHRYAKELWRKLAAELIEGGLLTPIDLPAFEMTCAAYSTYREARDAIYRPHGKRRTLAQYLESRSAQTALELQTMRNAWATYKSYLTEFGLAPASRGRIEIAPPKQEAKDPMEALIDEA